MAASTSTSPKVPADVRDKLQALIRLHHGNDGCHVTAIEGEYEYFYGEKVTPGQFGFTSWDQLVCFVPELKIQTLRGCRFIVAEPLKREIAADLLKKAFNNEVEKNKEPQSKETAAKAGQGLGLVTIKPKPAPKPPVAAVTRMMRDSKFTARTARTPCVDSDDDDNDPYYMRSSVHDVCDFNSDTDQVDDY